MMDKVDTQCMELNYESYKLSHEKLDKLYKKLVTIIPKVYMVNELKKKRKLRKCLVSGLA